MHCGDHVVAIALLFTMNIFWGRVGLWGIFALKHQPGISRGHCHAHYPRVIIPVIINVAVP